MVFIWFCWRENEEFLNMEMFLIESLFGRVKVFGGCFGYGVGKMNIIEFFLEINMNKIGFKSIYVFKLIVEKENWIFVVYYILRVELFIEFFIR